MTATHPSERPGRHPRARALLLVLAAAALVLSVAGWRDRDREEEELPFEVARIFFELNDTDGDLGIHALVDGEPWKKLEIEGAWGRELLEIEVDAGLRRQGLTELLFESAEPGFDELGPERFFRRFPEGTYEIEGRTLDGGRLESETEITHLLPAPPGSVTVSGVPAGNEDVDCEESIVVVSEPVVIRWAPVTRSHPELGRKDGPIEVVLYQLVVEREEPEVLVYSVELPPDVTEMEVPSGFLALGEEFKLEIVVREASGNQTALESCFAVE